ncbi:hypothetical protein BDR26DRAFT_876387 [Obelidium mucronatum]|nr:hypothetical protein BDR26DRAFT_876387 [Obelidium mucronatum]
MSDERPPNTTLFLLENFDAICNGTNVLFREFSYIKATPQNRLSFSAQYSALLNSNPEQNFKPADYFHLVELISTGFPYELIQRPVNVTEYILGLREPAPQNRENNSTLADGGGVIAAATGIAIPKKSFLLYFKLCFYYMEFMDLTRQCFQSVLKEYPEPIITKPPESDDLVVYTSKDLQSLKLLFVADLELSLENLPSFTKVPPRKNLTAAIERTFSGSQLTCASLHNCASLLQFELIRNVCLMETSI